MKIYRAPEERAVRIIFDSDEEYDQKAFKVSLGTDWIPVSERLPKERGIYIVTEKVFSLDDREHKGRYNIMVEPAEYSDGKWRRARFFEVITWMPLPKPYSDK